MVECVLMVEYGFVDEYFLNVEFEAMVEWGFVEDFG